MTPEATASDLLETARAVFTEHWHHADFRPQQREIIAHALNGEDVFAVLPTGFGKSVCYQLPAMLVEGTALVISPLIALMKDQTDDATERGIAASYLNSHVEEDVQEDRLHKLQQGRYDLFYVAPERIRSKAFRAAVQNTEVSYLVIDECHCCSRWGHDFRPAYMRIADLLDIFDDGGYRPPIIAVTATATPDIERDIVRAVGMDPDEYQRVIADPVRPNLQYEVWHGNEWHNLDRAIGRCNPDQGRHIFYSATRGGAERISKNVEEILDIEGVCGVYHAGLDKPTRERMQEDFKAGRTRIIAATCAFGMGIDVPNIRSVVHFGIPLSLEDYVQEAGRAGRDGLPSYVTCIDSPFVQDLRGAMIDSSNPPYEYFEILWRWLHATLMEGETLFRSAQAVSLALAQDTGQKVSTQAVTGVLSTLESKGLVARGYLPSGMQVTLRPGALRAAMEDPHRTPGARATLRALWTEVVQPQLPAGWPADQEVELAVDAKAVAAAADVREATVRKHLRDAECCKVARAFSGKTTRLLQHGQALADLLPRPDIDEKRRRALQRLAEMVGYMHTNTREDFIRAYFMRGVGTGA